MQQSRPSILKRIIASVITITGVVVFTVVIVHAVSVSANDPEEPQKSSGWLAPVTTIVNDAKDIVVRTTATPTKKAAAVIPKNYPVTLSIPSIGVKAKVQYVGITSIGKLAVPSNFKDVAWYKGGTIPGETGTAIFDGHLDDGLGLPAVFWNLTKLTNGDEIDVITEGGDKMRFKVTKSDIYAIDDQNAASEIFAPSSVPTIRLITCDGDWDSTAKMYNKRFVVTAELISS